MNYDLSMNANQLVAFLQKTTSEFTKADIISFIQQKDIRMVNFMYPAGDGRLKTLNFVINNQAYLEAILTCGERVDGSSLFSFIEAGSSDLYVIPRFCTAFVDPFAEIPTLSMLCSFFNKDGEPLESAPEHTLYKASKTFTEVTGMEFQSSLDNLPHSNYNIYIPRSFPFSFFYYKLLTNFCYFFINHSENVISARTAGSVCHDKAHSHH